MRGIRSPAIIICSQQCSRISAVTRWYHGNAGQGSINTEHEILSVDIIKLPQMWWELCQKEVG
jgi:hypothetical protein